VFGVLVCVRKFVGEHVCMSVGVCVCVVNKCVCVCTA